MDIKIDPAKVQAIRYRKQLVCKQCGWLSQVHVIYEHQDGDKEVICTVCGKWQYRRVKREGEELFDH